VHSFTYDAENRVVSVDGGSTATYSYDNQNRRVKKVVGSTTTHYVWQGGQVIAEHNGSTGGVIVDYIFAGGRMIAREGGSGRIFLLNDGLSVRATITDGQGGIQGRQSHLPFGEELVGTGTTDKHRFTSYERDSETGTDYAVNRQYAQSIGRFNRTDPYSGSYNLSDPQSLNRYSYVQNDSINAVDPLGLDAFSGGGIPLPGFDYARGCFLIQPPPSISSLPLVTVVLCSHDENGVGGGVGWGGLPQLPLLDYWVQELILALKNLKEGCKSFFGGSGTIDHRISQIKNGTLPLRILPWDSNALIPNSPNGQTFSQYWNGLPGNIQNNSVAYTVNYDNQAQPYNSIIVGPLFYSGVPALLPFVNNDLGIFRSLTLVHEFMHVLNNMGDRALFEKWEKEGAKLDGSLHPAIALFKFLAEDCPRK
jgi:RHS repeat-associated protein